MFNKIGIIVGRLLALYIMYFGIIDLIFFHKYYSTILMFCIAVAIHYASDRWFLEHKLNSDINKIKHFFIN